MTQPNLNHLKQKIIFQSDILAATAISTGAGIARAAYASWNGYSVKELDFSKITELLGKTAQKSLQKGSFLVGITTFVSCLSDKTGKYLVSLVVANRNFHEVSGICASALSIVATTNLLQRTKALTRKQAMIHMAITGVSYLFYKCISLYNQSSTIRQFQTIGNKERQSLTRIQKLEQEKEKLQATIKVLSNTPTDPEERIEFIDTRLERINQEINAINQQETAQKELNEKSLEIKKLNEQKQELQDQIDKLKLRNRNNPAQPSMQDLQALLHQAQHQNLKKTVLEEVVNQKPNDEDTLN